MKKTSSLKLSVVHIYHKNCPLTHGRAKKYMVNAAGRRAARMPSRLHLWAVQRHGHNPVKGAAWGAGYCIFALPVV